MAQSEGAAVRQAYDGPDLDHDDLIDQIQERSADEYARASDASESGAKLKEFLEDTGLNSQAFSWLKAIMKKMPKKDGQAKAMDVIRSLEAGLPMVKAHVTGQGTAEMNLDAEPGDPAEPMSDADVEEMGRAMDVELDEGFGGGANVEHVDFPEAS